jgi:hypothetical protein
MKKQDTPPSVYIIHENSEWLVPLKEAFDELGTPYVDWFINEQSVDFQSEPPQGVFYNRMSASSHTRGHRYAPEITQALLGWLESHGRLVINGSAAVDIEVSKIRQLFSLQSFGILTPRTVAINATALLVQTAKKFGAPFILKPNRGGKGTGVQLFHSVEGLEKAIATNSIGETLDGIWLIQEYIKPADSTITRVEIIGDKFLYAVKVVASDDFNLCPADSCQVEAAFCPVGAEASKFTIQKDYSNDDLDKYRQFLKANDIGIGALEYAKDESGKRFVYDVNTNTNYNRKAEISAGDKRRGMMSIARYLTSLLNRKRGVKPTKAVKSSKLL